VSGICLAAGALHAVLLANAFTLSWTHSVEKTEWQEDYRVVSGTLRLEAARIKGSGAGMEPPADAVLRDGWWEYRPHLAPMPALRLTFSHATADYRLCWAEGCKSLGELLPNLGDPTVVELRPCNVP
jgi:hypothetical protein